MVEPTLLEEIKAFCKVNEIEDVDAFVNKMLKERFMVIKWGSINGPKLGTIKQPEPTKITKEDIIPVKPMDMPTYLNDPKKPKNKDLYGE